jgi:hypothetical protein
VSVTGSTAVPINNPQQTVAFIQPGMTFSTRSAASSYLQCVSFNKSSATDSGSALADGLGTVVRFSEGFASSFKTRNIAAYALAGASPQPVAQNVPGQNYNTESGFYNITPNVVGGSANGLSAAGLADHGTRLMARFANIPAGVALYASVYPVGSSTTIDGTCLGPSSGGACIKSALTQTVAVRSRASARRIPLAKKEQAWLLLLSTTALVWLFGKSLMPTRSPFRHMSSVSAWPSPPTRPLICLGLARLRLPAISLHSAP